MVSTRQATRLVPLQGHASRRASRSMLVTGVLAFAGTMMVIPLFVPSRWRRSYGDEADEDYVDMPPAIGLIP